MFPKVFHAVTSNATYTLSGILFATATCFILKTLLEQSLKFYKLWKEARKFPGPTALPILGNVHQLLGDRENFLKQLTGWAKCYPSMYRMWLGHKLNFVLYEADAIKEVLQNQKVVEKSEVYQFVQPFIGNGLIIAEVNEWRTHRKLINNVFNHRVLPRYGTFMAKKAQEMVKEMEVELHGKGFDISHYASVCTLRMIFGVILGTSLKFESEELLNFHKSFNRYVDIGFFRIPRVWLYPAIIFNRTSLGRECEAIVERLVDTIAKANQAAEFARAKDKLLRDKNDVAVNGVIEDENIPGLYMNLPRDRDDFTNQDFIDELNTIIVTGSHTIDGQIIFMTRMLAQHPDVQEKVYEELYSIYGSEDPADRPVTLEDLPRLEYLECVIHESMRLFPPVGFIERAITKDVDLGSCVLPAGSTVLINILSLHRSEKYWPNPLKFDPDRFLPENVAKRQPCTYIPFSWGPRNCIGNKYAMMIIKILSATLLRRYTLRVDRAVPIEEIRLMANVVLEFVEPWYLRIEERRVRKMEAKC